MQTTAPCISRTELIPSASGHAIESQLFRFSAIPAKARIQSRPQRDTIGSGCRITSGMTIQGFLRDHQYWDLEFQADNRGSKLFPSDGTSFNFDITVNVSI
jgi:hypothetical protein